MAELQALRIRLNFVRAYLYTCSPKSFEELQCQFFGKDYLYEHIHQYSIADLAMIQRGTLYQQLHKAFKLGEAHILKCVLCSYKGFICEICNSSRILYPFHIETTFRVSIIKGPNLSCNFQKYIIHICLFIEMKLLIFSVLLVEQFFMPTV